ANTPLTGSAAQPTVSQCRFRAKKYVPVRLRTSFYYDIARLFGDRGRWAWSKAMMRRLPKPNWWMIVKLYSKYALIEVLAQPRNWSAASKALAIHLLVFPHIPKKTSY